MEDILDFAAQASGGAAKYVRWGKVTFPNGREVHYNYDAAGLGYALGRAADIADGNGASPNMYAAYKPACRQAGISERARWSR